MKKILSVNYSDAAFNISMLLLRLSFGLYMITKHGIVKLMNFSTLQHSFYNFLGMGSNITLLLGIFAELFCSMFIILGLFTRIAVIPLLVTMLVAIFGAGAGKPVIQFEVPAAYATVFFVLLLCGPGKISVDGMINK